jgi:hypothetical protein
MSEVNWLPVSGADGYQVSTEGRIKSPSGKLLRENETVTMAMKSYRVNRLVANHFIPNPDNLPNIRNINGDKTDNRVENLRWTADAGTKKITEVQVQMMTEGRFKNWSNAKVARHYGLNVKTIKKWRD